MEFAYAEKLDVDGVSSPLCAADYTKCDVSGFKCVKRTASTIGDIEADGYKSALVKDSTLTEGGVKYACIKDSVSKDLEEITGQLSISTTVTTAYEI